MKFIKLFRKYNYYTEIRNKSNEIYYKYNLAEYIEKDTNGKYSNLSEVIVKEKLYNLILNICNQIIYDYNYKFTMDDILFIQKFEIDKIFNYIIEYIIKDILVMKKKAKK